LAGIRELSLLNVIYFWGVMKDLRKEIERVIKKWTWDDGSLCSDAVGDLETLFKNTLKGLRMKEEKILPGNLRDWEKGYNQAVKEFNYRLDKLKGK